MDWGMIGHAWAINLLAEHVALGRERHAYLFTGPVGVGKRTLALRFAQSLNCTNPPSPGQPCRKCTHCVRIDHMQHPDLTVVQAEREGLTLKVDQVRELQHTLSLAPYEAKYRVALILRFEEAHPSAANALLKTLEEPPARVVVILTAKNVESLLPTIVSRCDVLRLRTLPLEETARGLQTIRGIPQEWAEKLAHISDGRPGYAIQLFEQPALRQKRQTGLETLLQMLASPIKDRFAYAKGASDDKEALRVNLQTWLTFWRDILIFTSGVSRSITNSDYLSQVQQLAGIVDIHQAQEQVNAVERTIEQIDRNVNPRLALEILLMDFPKTDFLG
jgi:DNA polymerase-3 subunit delta'